MSSNMPCSATAEELRTDAGTKSDMPQAEMSLREIAEAFVKDPDADVVGAVENVLLLRKQARSTSPLLDHNKTIIYGVDALGADIIDFVEGKQ